MSIRFDQITRKALAEASGVVKHGRDTVEPEAVKAIDVNPHPQVGK